MRTLVFAVAYLGLCVAVFAQSNTAPGSSSTDNGPMEQKLRDLEDRVIALEGQLRLLKSPQTQPAQPAAPVAGQQQAATAAQNQSQPASSLPAPGQMPAPAVAQSAGEAGPGGQLPVYGGASAAAKALNPDISMIGDFIGAVGGNSAPLLATAQPFPSLQMHESELGVQAIIDPYARGDFFLSFGEEGVNVEEGFITFTALPKGFTARVGKMRSAFGKVNMMHNHVLPWVDRPLVTTNLVGGEDGIDDAGVSIEHILPAPKGFFMDVTGQVFRGDSDGVYQAVKRSDVSTVDHLRVYKDLTESTNLDIGFSYSRGHSAPGLLLSNGGPGGIGSVMMSPATVGSNDITNLYGIDATLRWKPLRRSIYHSFVARSEFIWSQRHQISNEQRAFGFYTAADYQFARRWFLGARYDQSGRAQFAGLTDRGGSLVLTYWPSEFSQIRGQYRFTRYAENIDANELLMQVIFSLGAHGAHPF